MTENWNYDEQFILKWDHFLKLGRDLETEALLSWFRELSAAMDPRRAKHGDLHFGYNRRAKGCLNLQCQCDAARSYVDVRVPGNARRLCPLLSFLSAISLRRFSHSSSHSLQVTVTHFGESIETVQSDLAEVSPTVFLGVPRIWERMHSRINLKMKDASWLKKTLYNWALGTGEVFRTAQAQNKTSLILRFKNWLGDLLIFRALQERLGLRRVRFAVSGASAHLARSHRLVP